MMVRQDDTSRQQVHPDPALMDNSAMAEDYKPRRNFIVGTGVGNASHEMINSDRDSITMTKADARASIEVVEDVDADKRGTNPNSQQTKAVNHGPSRSIETLAVQSEKQGPSRSPNTSPRLNQKGVTGAKIDTGLRRKKPESRQNSAQKQNQSSA